MAAPTTPVSQMRTSYWTISRMVVQPPAIQTHEYSTRGPIALKPEVGSVSGSPVRRRAAAAGGALD
jgi:hypothetical protein